ncbi:MAG: MFS transporter [Chloroflexi bacterium]|nr:MAG: MFS transporter [Chloroflexota bacterium]
MLRAPGHGPPVCPIQTRGNLPVARFAVRITILSIRYSFDVEVSHAARCVQTPADTGENRARRSAAVSRQRTIVIVAGIMLSLFMASMESTVIATAMPTIVAQLGGLSIYSWAFSAYMLTSTCTVPVYGKLSDIYGRRNIYAIAMAIFLVGSVLCGLAGTMEQLVFFRAVQGIGAGGVMPLAFIIIGDIFTFEQRARMQGWFSGVWGVSSIVGPLLGGFIVDNLSWHWVFYVNVLPGTLALVLVWLAWKRRGERHTVSVDYAGAALLMSGVVVLLLGLAELDRPRGLLLVGAAVALFIALYFVERRSANPVLPLYLFKERLFATATLHGILAGWAMFGSLSFVPLFVQAVLGTSATEAGSTLTPMMLAWVVGSIIGSRLLLTRGYRTIALVGMVSLTLGSFLISQIGSDARRWEMMVYLGMMGIGMGLSVPSFLIAVQSAVQKRDLGTATSTLQFSRSMGGTLGVSVMGVFLTMRLANALVAAGIDPGTVPMDSLIGGEGGAELPAALMDTIRAALAVSIEGVFWLAFIAAALGLVATAFAPAGRIGQTKAMPGVEPLRAQGPEGKLEAIGGSTAEDTQNTRVKEEAEPI